MSLSVSLSVPVSLCLFSFFSIALNRLFATCTWWSWSLPITVYNTRHNYIPDCVCICVFEQYEFMLWKIFTYNLARACRRRGRAGGCVCDGHSKDKHACLSRSFVLSNSNASTSFYFHTHTCRADEMSECKRAKKISLLCAVCLWECGWSLPVSHSLSPTALANNEMYSNSPTQSIGLFVLHVCYSRSPFLLLILIQRFVQISAKLLLCLSIFLILSQPAASTHKIQKKEAKKKRRKTNTL